MGALVVAITAACGACRLADAPPAPGAEIPPAAEVALPVAASPTEPPAKATPELPANVDPKDLDAAEKKILVEILAEQFDPCGKTRSFLDALRAGDCPSAPRLAARLVDFIGVRGLGKKQAVEALAREIERINTVHTIDVGASPRRGPADAKVVIVEFSDFECPFCRRAIAPLERLRAHYGVALTFKFFPLRLNHPNAEGAARAAWAAHQQGKFWEMHDALFENQHALDFPSVQKLARKVGLDPKKFDAAVASAEAKAAVEADEKAGEAAQVDGTPTFYVSGRKCESLAQVEDMLREALQAAGQPLPPALGAAAVGEPPPAPK